VCNIDIIGLTKIRKSFLRIFEFGNVGYWKNNFGYYRVTAERKTSKSSVMQVPAVITV
jgi:hypothetical protein